MTEFRDLSARPAAEFEAWLADVEARPAVDPDDDAREDAQRGHYERQVAQELLAARPWDAAEPESLWSITGQYPEGKGTFTDCLAITLPQYVTGSEKPTFAMLPPLSLGGGGLVDPAWITRAEPLLIVLRDEPTVAYWEQDQDLVDGDT